MAHHKLDIHESLISQDGKYDLVQKKGRSELWNHFGQVIHVESGTKLSFHACFTCMTVYTDSGGGTGNMARHKCVPLISSLNQILDKVLPKEETADGDNQPSPSNINQPLKLEDLLLHSKKTHVKQELPDESGYRQDIGEYMAIDIFNSIIHDVKEEQIDKETGEILPSVALLKKSVGVQNESRDQTDKVTLRRLLAENSPDIVMTKHHRYASISIVQRYRETTNGEKVLMKTLYVICTKCFAMLKNAEGGHIHRHVQTTCQGEQKKAIKLPWSILDSPIHPGHLQESPGRNDALILATYCLESCQEFSTIEERSFTKMICKIANLSTVLPSQEEVEMEAFKLYQDLKSKALRQVRKAIHLGNVVLIVDMEKYIPEFLSVFASFTEIESEQQLHWNNVIPIGFKNFSKNMEDPEKIFNTILELCQLFGLSQQEVYSCTLSSEPHPFMEHCGITYMMDYVPLVPYDLDPVIKNILYPPKTLLNKLSLEQVEFSNTIRNSIELCQMVAQETRNNPQLKSLDQKLIRIGKDEWTRLFLLVNDILCNWEDVFVRKDFFQSVDVTLLGREKETLKAFSTVFSLFLNKTLTTEEVLTTHMVAPFYKQLLNDLKKIFQNSEETKICRILGDLTRMAMEEHYEKVIGITHWAATLLCPITKNMTKFTAEERRMAKCHVAAMLSKLGTGEKLSKRRKYTDSLMEEGTDHPEMTAYLGQLVPKSTSLVKFWFQSVHLYPSLSRVARRIFACQPVGLICNQYKSVIERWGHTSYIQNNHQWAILASALIENSNCCSK